MAILRCVSNERLQKNQNCILLYLFSEYPCFDKWRDEVAGVCKCNAGLFGDNCQKGKQTFPPEIEYQITWNLQTMSKLFIVLSTRI